MKCPNRGGKGMVDYPMYADERHEWQYCVARMKKCDICNGTGEVEQTNEEWFCQLSTEEKAEFLEKITDPRVGYLVGYWQEWLKQPHSEE